MKTQIHFYSFDVDNAGQRAAYDALVKELKATPGRGHCMKAAGQYAKGASALDGSTIELETAHLFENQWNTAPIPGYSETGLRVFDWAEQAADSRIFQHSSDWAPGNIRRGHYLDITEEMRRLRAETVACGYCGKQRPAADAPAFCEHCLDSEYLKETELHLLRLRPINTRFNVKREPLTEAEAAELVPAYRSAQIHGSTERGKARIAADRARVIAKAGKATKDAATERDGFLFWMDRGIQTGNLIFYNHTGRFCFGWREPVSDSVCDALLEHTAEFPFAYDIITAPGGKHGGRTLSAD